MFPCEYGFLICCAPFENEPFICINENRQKYRQNCNQQKNEKLNLRIRITSSFVVWSLVVKYV